MYEFKLPDLGEGIHEAELLKWFVKVGDQVASDASLCEVETDKAAVVIPSPVAGKVVSLGGKPGDTLVTGNVFITIDDGTASAKATEPVAAAPAPAKAASLAPPAPASVVVAPGRLVPAAPSTRRIARELGIDINTLSGTGPGGRVTPEDVRRHASGAAAPVAPATAVASTALAAVATVESVASPMRSSSSSLPPSQIPLFEVEPMPDFGTQGPVEREALRSVRRKIAKRMVTSMVVVPHVCHMEEIDITELDKVRREINGRLAAGQPKLTMMAFVLKALIPALRQFPMFNASLDTEREEIVYKKYFNLGFATDTEKGLVVPVIHAAADKSVSQLAEAIRSLSGKARDGKLEVQEMRGGTFTVTNIGALGGVAMVPTINYPETAILGMARVQEKPVVRDGAIVVRTMLPVTLAFDHRVADGADAARFVNELARRLSNSQVFLTET